MMYGCDCCGLSIYLLYSTCCMGVTAVGCLYTCSILHAVWVSLLWVVCIPALFYMLYGCDCCGLSVHLLYSTGCMGMVAMGREDIESQNKIVEQGGIQPLVRLLRSQKTSQRVLLTVIKVLGTLCLGKY